MTQARRIIPGTDSNIGVVRILSDEELYLEQLPAPETVIDTPELTALKEEAQDIQDRRFEMTVAEFSDRALDLGAKRLDLLLEEQGRPPVHQHYLREARQSPESFAMYHRGKGLLKDRKRIVNFTHIGKKIEETVGVGVVDPIIWLRACQKGFPPHHLAEELSQASFSTEEAAIVALLLCRQEGYRRQRELTSSALRFNTPQPFDIIVPEVGTEDFWRRRVNAISYQRGHIVKVSGVLDNLAGQVYGHDAKRALTLLGMATFLRTKERPDNMQVNNMRAPIFSAIQSQNFDQAELLLRALAENYPQMIPDHTWARLVSNDQELAFLTKQYEKPQTT